MKKTITSHKLIFMHFSTHKEKTLFLNKILLNLFRPLVFLGMNLLLHFDVHKTLGCDEKTLYNWLTVIERHYHVTNTYHNSSHAADVLQATACFLERERIKRLLDELDEACCLIAAACHDIDHPGKSRWSTEYNKKKDQQNCYDFFM